jgi:hypothetical protein
MKVIKSADSDMFIFDVVIFFIFFVKNLLTNSFKKKTIKKLKKKKKKIKNQYIHHLQRNIDCFHIFWHS